MTPEMATGLAILVVLLIGIFIGCLIGKGRIAIKTRLLEKNIAKVQTFLDECKDKTETEVKGLIEKARRYLD